MELPLFGGGLLAVIALLLGIYALRSVFRLTAAARPVAAESDSERAERTERAGRERARVGFLALAIVMVLACASVFYVLSNFL